MSNNDAPGWVDDGTLSWSPARELSFTPASAAPRIGPWSPAAGNVAVEDSAAALTWPWRLGIGLAQGLAFYFLFHTRALQQWPGHDPFLFDAIALPLLLMPWALMAGLGRIALPRLAVFIALFTAILAGLGWYHRWRIAGIAHGQPGLSLLVLAALALFLSECFLEAGNGRGRLRYADLFQACATMAARLLMLALVVGVGLLLTPLLPRLTLESGDIIAMPGLGLCGALAFQATALPRFAQALSRALVATATVLAPLAVAGALLMLGTALAAAPPALLFILALMGALVIAISAIHGDGETQPAAWRENFAFFAAILLLALAGLAIWVLHARVMVLGWTAARLFGAALAGLFAAYGIGYCISGLAGLMRGTGMRGIAVVNTALGLATIFGALALATPLADPLRLAAVSQAARLEQGQVALEQFDFANLPRDSARFGATALAGLSHSLYPDIARAAQGFQGAVRGAVTAPANPTEIGANIAVRTQGARLPAALLARDWHAVAGAPACLTAASEPCDAYFLDLNTDGRPEILLVTGSETRWWGAVMEADEAGRWKMAGRLAAGCGATLSDLRAGRFGVLSALPGWSDLSVSGTRLTVTPSGNGCSHY